MSKRVDSIAQLVVEQTDNAYFSLAVNRDAQQAHPDFSPVELQNILEDYVLSTNDNAVILGVGLSTMSLSDTC